MIHVTEDALEELLRLARKEGWETRHNEEGTYYEVGTYRDYDEYDEEYDASKVDSDGLTWDANFKTTSYVDAKTTAYRWGCDYRTYRKNPYSESKEKYND